MLWASEYLQTKIAGTVYPTPPPGQVRSDVNMPRPRSLTPPDPVDVFAKKFRESIKPRPEPGKVSNWFPMIKARPIELGTRLKQNTQQTAGGASNNVGSSSGRM